MLTLWLIAQPLLAGIVLLLWRNTPKQSALIASLIELALTLGIWWKFTPDASSQLAVSYPWLASAGINFSVGIDGISILLVLLTGILVPLIILSTFNHHYKNPSVFYALILFMQAALVGVFTARDAFLFYFFFEAALIPIYFIAALWGSDNSVRITFKFFVYTIFGSLFMLLALVYLYFQTPGTHTADITALYQLTLTDTQQTYIFWAFFVAFAIKMPVFPFHTWQPDTYTESPTPATMLLAGIMLKMGTYGLIRLLLPIVPEGVAQWGGTAMVLSIVGIVYGSIIAIQQKDIKRLLAYSSFAHVGLISAGIFSQTLSGIQGALIQMLAHGITVVGLFFVAEIVFTRTKSRDIEKLGGITQNTPQLTVYFMILMLGSVALPLTSGFVGEFLLLKGVYEYNSWLGATAGLTIILGAVYMLRLFQKTMFGEKRNITEHFADLNFTEKAVLLPLVVLVFLMGIYPNLFLKLTEPAVTQFIQTLTK
jgi:NADH-quinone oxidoreductase subunit M